MGKTDVKETNRQINSDTKGNSKQQEVVENANERPDWLPGGWNFEVKIRKSGAHMGSPYKCYIDPLKGLKFYSKPEVLRYLETVKDSSCTPKKGKKRTNMHSPSNILDNIAIKDSSCTPKKDKKCTTMPSPTKILDNITTQDSNCTPKMEKKCSNIPSPSNILDNITTKDSTCTPKKGKKCTNMPSPSNILDNITTKDSSSTPEKETKCTNMPSLSNILDNRTVKDSSCTPKEEKKCTNMHSPSNVVVEKSTLEDLPPGWIKEVKIRKSGKGTKKDPYYKDPVTGYVFRSKKDVLRYLESGDIGSCVFKPHRSQIQNEDKLTPSPAAKRQNLKQSASKQQLFVVKKLVDKSSLESADVNNSRKGQDVDVPSGINENKDGVQEKNHSNHRASKNKEFNVRHRSSPRLAGVEPVQLVNNVINEQTLQVPKRNLRKSRSTQDVDMESKSSQHFNGVPDKMQQVAVSTGNDLSEDQVVSREQHQLERDKTENSKPGIHSNSNKSSKKKEHCIPRRASSRLAGLKQSEARPVTELANHAPIKGESGSRRIKSPKVPPTAGHQLEKHEDEEMDDEKSEPQLSFAFHYSWSDPCVEFAINTLTGVLPPVVSSVVNGPTTVSETDIQKTLVDNATAISKDNENNSVDKNPTTVPAVDIQNKVFDNVKGRSRDNQNSSVDEGPSTLPAIDIQNKVFDKVTGRSRDNQNSSVDEGPTTVPAVDIQNKVFDNVTGRSRDNQNCSVDEGPTTVPVVDIQNKVFDNVTGRSRDNQNSSIDEGPTTVPAVDIQNKVFDNVTGRSRDNQNSSVDEGPTTVPAVDIQNKVFDNVTGRSRDNQNSSVDEGPTTVPAVDIQNKVFDNVTRRSRDNQNSSVDNGPTTVSETDIKMVDNVTGGSRDNQNNLLGNVTGSRGRSPQVHSNKSKRKKEVKVPIRLSKRLAGVEPDVPPSERALEYSAKKSCKEPTTTATAILSDRVSEFDHVDAGGKTNLTNTSGSLETEVLGESSKKCKKSYYAQTVRKEQLQQAGAENIGNERSEPHVSLPFGDSWSDPCLDFAFKTLTGVLPVDSATDILPVTTPAVDEPPNKELRERVVAGINGEAHHISNQWQNKKELNMDGQPSKLFLGQPDLNTSSTSYGNAPNFTAGESHNDEGNMIRNWNGEPLHIEAGNGKPLVHHSSGSIHTEIHGEPLQKNGQVVGGEFGTAARPPLQTETLDLNHDNTEFQFCDSFMDSWSDPCLEFAYKTLTGEIPVEENIGTQGCVQQPACGNERRDDLSTMPDFGFSSFSQNDISFQYDIGMKSMSGQQSSSMSSSFPSTENASLQSYPPGFGPQKYYAQYNKSSSFPSTENASYPPGFDPRKDYPQYNKNFQR